MVYRKKDLFNYVGGYGLEIKDIISLVITIIVALIGVSSVMKYKTKKGKVKQNNTSGDNVNVEQHIQNGNGNIQAGKNVNIKTKNWK